MWRNREVLGFVSWLHGLNAERDELARVGFYGLDLYSLRGSMQAVIGYLEAVDPEAAQRARARYGCFDQFGDEPQVYGYATAFNLHPGCERDVVNQLLQLRERSFDYLAQDGLAANDERFCAEQNARVARNAEQYYREMYRGSDRSWNLRDSHMADTVHELRRHLEGLGRAPKVVVWAHNSHLGDARATSMSRRGEHNLGQLLREQLGDEVVSLGMITYEGTVAAASAWDGPVQIKNVLPGRPDSHEGLLHLGGEPGLLLDPRQVAGLSQPLLQRAIGVLYLPETELMSHYMSARLTEQFDLLLHMDRTSAVEPLEAAQPREQPRAPETYPHGV
jgi:erythromycin esterase-like protein